MAAVAVSPIASHWMCRDFLAQDRFNEHNTTRSPRSRYKKSRERIISQYHKREDSLKFCPNKLSYHDLSKEGYSNERRVEPAASPAKRTKQPLQGPLEDELTKDLFALNIKADQLPSSVRKEGFGEDLSERVNETPETPDEDNLKSDFQALLIANNLQCLCQLCQDPTKDYQYEQSSNDCAFECDQTDFDFDREYEKWETTQDISMFLEQDREHDSQLHEVFHPEDPISPIIVPAPFGSGRKGKDKGKDEYAAGASTFGWGGSHNSYSTNGAARRDESEQNRDPKSNKNSGSEGGSGGSDGGGGGGDERDRGAVASGTRITQTPDDRPATDSCLPAPTPRPYSNINTPMLGGGSGSIWTCCECNESGSTCYIEHCVTCRHTRCSTCNIYRPK